MRKLSAQERAEGVPALVQQMSPASDCPLNTLTAWAQAFIDAHEALPEHPSLEIGTRLGGSALVFLNLLNWMYEEIDRPFLFTVDPYGCKPYNNGERGGQGAPVYSGQTYVAAKRNLAIFPNHAHFLMVSHQFFDRCLGMRYWRPVASSPIVEGQDMNTGTPMRLPVGQEQRLTGFNFALLDGDHSALNIQHEMRELRRCLAIGARVVVDNIDADPETEHVLATAEKIDGFSRIAPVLPDCAIFTWQG